MSKKILLIYTGGTIGMIRDSQKNNLIPFTLDGLLSAIPELKSDEVLIEYKSIKKPIDSSNMEIYVWLEIAEIIETNYEKYNGFVILHGTDTMSYTASALSFMLENINKSIILTGSQIPIGVRRTDAKENLITAIDIASSEKINEVCIYFENELYRGNRTSKINTEDFEAFKSPNYPVLAEVGVKIKYGKHLLKRNNKSLKVYKNISNDVAVLKLFPGIKIDLIKAILESAKGIVIESFGAGNASTNTQLINLLEEMIAKGKILVNITQCMYGNVMKGEYAASAPFQNKKIICGNDITTEAAITKLMFLIGEYNSDKKIRSLLKKDLRGELNC